jgi:GNAT superfamily N-acetyltransferase
MLSFSIADSNRFGLQVHRGVSESFNLLGLNQYIADNNPDLLILRYAAETIENHHLLKSLNYDLLFTDALVYYDINLNKLEPKPFRNNLQFIEVQEGDLDKLREIVPIIFKEYKNHYFSNPDLNKSHILEGYIEWASAYVNSVQPDRKSWLVYKEETLIGFATCAMYAADNSCEGVLYGVHPGYAGGGVYTDIIRFTQNYFKDAGYDKMIVSTQIQNYAVQKVWQKEGFLIAKAYYTYHLMRKKNDTL